MNVHWLPGARVPLKLLFGKAAEKQTADSDLPRWTAPASKDEFVYAASAQASQQTSKTPAPPLKTKVESLINGEQIFGKIDTLLNTAKSSVLVDMYNLQNPALYPERSSIDGTPGAASQAQIIDRLIALKNKGLKVKVILDNHWDADMRENYNDRTINHLRANGVEVVTYPDFAKISHVKLLLVDDTFAVIGGMNWGNHSATNHDAAVFIEGADVRNIYNDIFKTDWLSSGGNAADIPDVPAFPEGKIKVLTTTPKDSVDGGRDSILKEILTQIGKAQESIYAELFVLTQSDIVDNLIFAHKRLTKVGKEGVKILVDPGLYFSFPNTRKGVQKLAKAGIPIKFYKANRDTEEKLHAKWAVFDKKTLLIGSANWSIAGLVSNNKDDKPVTFPNGEVANIMKKSGSNHEADVLIESAALSKAYVDQFSFDWKNRTFPILTKAEDGSGKWKRLKPELAFA